MREVIKICLKYLIIYIILISSFLLLLTVTSLIPTDIIEENVKETSELLVSQKNKFYVPLRKWNMMYDNYTDALMINTAYSIDNTKPFYSAMVARKNYIPDVTKKVYEDTTGKLKYSSKYTELDQVRRIKRYSK